MIMYYFHQRNVVIIRYYILEYKKYRVSEQIQIKYNHKINQFKQNISQLKIYNF